MEEGITYVGMDAHKDSIKVAMLLPGETKPVEWQLANEKVAVARTVRKVQRLASGEVRFCYEAGPLRLRAAALDPGSGLQLHRGLIPRKPGDRIKTDRRDARKLAELFRAGLLTEVHPPTPQDEAVRDLCRAREDAHEDLVRCRHRVSKMLLRRGWVWNGSKKAWGQGHRLWLRSLRFEHQADQVVFDDLLAGDRPG
jgi:transposase